MANNPSALKRVRQNETRTASNRVFKTKVKNLRKGIDEAAASGDDKAISEALSRYSSAVDRAAKKEHLPPQQSCKPQKQGCCCH